MPKDNYGYENDDSFKIMVQTNGVNYHYLAGGSSEDDSDELAKDLVKLDPGVAADLARSIEAHLQDKFMNESTWGELAEEGLSDV